MKSVSTIGICVALAMSLPGLALAANIKSFVASSGSDAAGCTRAAPCLTFQGALAKTDPGGLIACLDAADFGPMTIIQAVSIVCDGARGSILQQGSAPAVKIQAGASDAVVLSGLDLQGAGSTAAWGTAVDIVSARSVLLDHGTVSGFTSGAAIAIYCENITPMTLAVANTMFSNNGTGMYCQPQADTASLKIVLHHTQFVANIEGLVEGSSTSRPVDVSISDSLFSMNSNGVDLRGGAVAISSSTIVDNYVGVNSSANVHLSSSTLVNIINTTASPPLVTYGDNQIDGTTYGWAITTAPLK